MSQDWDIQARSMVCQACQAPFADGQSYYTALTFETEGGYTRIDCCEACWPQVRANPTRYSSWKGVYRVPPSEPERKVRKETAESLLRLLTEGKETASRGTVYVLAVMLERQRVLVERAVQTGADGGRVIVYEHKKTGETFVIPDPQLRLSDLEPVQQEVMRLLTSQMPANAPADPAPLAEGPPAPASP